jgi:hypothetical protein
VQILSGELAVDGGLKVSREAPRECSNLAMMRSSSGTVSQCGLVWLLAETARSMDLGTNLATRYAQPLDSQSVDEPCACPL